MAKIRISLDTSKPQSRIDTVYGRQGETALSIEAEIFDNGDAYDFTGKYLTLDMKRENGIVATVTGEQHGNSNLWRVELPKEVTAEDGYWTLCYCTIHGDDGFREYTNRFMVYLEKSATHRARLTNYHDQADLLIKELEILLLANSNQIEVSNAAIAEANEKLDAMIRDVAVNRLGPYIDHYLVEKLSVSVEQVARNAVEEIADEYAARLMEAIARDLTGGAAKGLLRGGANDAG